MKILILRLSSLGDIVLTQPIAAWLRKQYPQAEIDLIVKEQYLELVALMGCGLNPLPYRKSISFHARLMQRRYDLVLDLHGKLSTWLLRIAAMGKMSAVYNKQRSTRLRIIRGDRDLKIGSTLDLYQSALAKLGMSSSLDLPRLYPPGIQLPELPQDSQKLILIFPGATYNTKRYPYTYYKKLIKESPKDWQYVISGSSAEWDLGQEIAQGNSSINLCGKLNFERLLDLIAKADWVISSDSGPMHLAAALQKPQIAIFGATHPRLGFAPLNPHARIIAQDLECQPCSLHGSESCPRGHFKCMLDISPNLLLSHLNNSTS